MAFETYVLVSYKFVTIKSVFSSISKYCIENVSSTYTRYLRKHLKIKNNNTKSSYYPNTVYIVGFLRFQS